MNRSQFHVTRPVLIGAALVLTLAIATAAIAAARPMLEASGGISSMAPPIQWTGGVPPFAALPGEAQPLEAALDGDDLVVLGARSDSDRLSLFRLDVVSRAVMETRLPLMSGNTLVALAVEPSGVAWAGAFNQLVRVDRAGTVTEFTVPPARHPLPFPGPGSPPGLPPAENGQITSLAVMGDRVLIGRLGKAELTSLQPATGKFDHHAMPPGLGDANEMTVGPGEKAVFAVRRSGSEPGRGYDAIGVVEPKTLQIGMLPFQARTVAANGSQIAFAGSGLGLLGADGVPLRPLRSGTDYDQVRIALRPDGTTIVRAMNNEHEVVFVSRDGSELKRVSYQVVIGKDRRGNAMPYSSAFSLALSDANGVVWFALWGRPEIYRID